MTNPAFDLASIAQQGQAAEKLPPRSRRKSQNPFTDIVRKVAEEKLTWQLPAVSTVETNGESVALQVERGIRQAGNAFDKAAKESGGAGWRTVIRKQPSADGTEVTISFKVEPRATGVDVSTDDAKAEDAGTVRRSRRSS
jgi:hypothetical protein